LQKRSYREEGLKIEMIQLALLLLLIPIGGFILFKDKKDNENEKIRCLTLDSLIREAREMLNNYGIHRYALRGSAAGNVLRTEEAVAHALRNCCSGLKGPRDAINTVVYRWLTEVKCPTEEEIDRIFTEAGNTWGRFECAIFMADKTGDGGFGKLWESRFKDVALCCGEISGTYVNDAYYCTCGFMSYGDKLKVLSKMLYAGATGFGKVDSLMWERGCIEEIQIGMSGCTKENYDFRESLKRRDADDKKNYSRDSIHVMISGIPIRLSFLSFDSDDEMIRILRNLIKNTGAGELTRRTPRIVADTPDGRRVTVSRPPFTDSWAGLVRKFDTVPKSSLDELIDDEELKNLVNEIIRTRKSIAVTGETASGKTTLLRALLLEIGRERSIRVIEAESFELNIREYLPDANTLTLRVTDSDSADRVLGFSKKTTGQVFAVGEVNTPEMAVVLTDVAKTAETILFTAHYKNTADMVRDFTNARLNAGGYSDERLAKSEAVNALGVDIHMRRKGGKRCIERISEVQDDGRIKCLWPLQAVGEERAS
jgi:Flp pilus assembly CpaF family ATPase